MGRNGRGKHKGSTRRPRSGRANIRGDADISHQVGVEELASHPCGATNTFCDNCGEEELERYLLMNLQLVYNEASVRLADLGYPQNVVLNAILSNGHSYGRKDVLSNILDNSLRYLTTGKLDENRPAFVSLQQLLDISLKGMLYVVQKTMPQLSRRDAMLHICRMNDPPNPEKFKFFIPSVVKNVKRDYTEGFSANSEKLQTHENGCSVTSLSNSDFSASFTSETEAVVEQIGQLQDAKCQAGDSPLLDIFLKFNLDESIEYVPLDDKDEMIIGFLQQVKDLEGQLKKTKEWAQKTEDQALRKVTNDVIELEKLRRERDQRLEKGNQNVEDTSMTKLWSMQYSLCDMQNNWRRENEELGRINALKSKLEFEYAEMSSELEASTLSASESMGNREEVAKREKKSLKRLLAWEKQKSALDKEAAAMEQEILQLETKLVQIEAAQKNFEEKRKEAHKAKESALEQLDEERRQLKEIERTNRREQADLHLKIETELQHHKDELQKLELDLCELKVHSSQANQLNIHSTKSPMVNFEEMETHGWFSERMLDKLENEEDFTSDRNCLICEEKEVSVVFLPCAHQILCSNCSAGYEKKGKTGCPCCGVLIEDIIQVFGAQSS